MEKEIGQIFISNRSLLNVVYKIEDFEIVETFRYEGDSDPGDEATVYAIESKAGIKGVLVTGYSSASSIPFDVLSKLVDRNQKDLK